MMCECHDTRVFITDNPLKPPRVEQYDTAHREVIGGEVKTFKHYYWPPLDFGAQVWVYPRPKAIEVRAWWEPEWTYVCDLKIQATTTVTVVVIINERIHEIIRIRPRRRRRGLPRPLQE